MGNSEITKRLEAIADYYDVSKKRFDAELKYVLPRLASKDHDVDEAFYEQSVKFRVKHYCKEMFLDWNISSNIPYALRKPWLPFPRLIPLNTGMNVTFDEIDEPHW